MSYLQQDSSVQKTFFSKFKLRNQLLLGYSIPIVVFFIATAIVYKNANKVFEAFVAVERAQKAIIETDVMAADGNGMVANHRAYLLSENSKYLDLYNDNWKNFQAASDRLEQSNTITNPQQKDRFEQMKQMGLDYDQYFNQVIALIKSGKKDEAMKLFNEGIGTKILASFTALNNEFNDVEVEKLLKEDLAAKNSLHEAINLLVFGSSIAAATGLTIAWLIASFVTQKISQSVNSIDNSSKEISLAVNQQEKITNSQAISVNETTTAMDQLSSSARQATQQAETSSNGAQQVLNLAQNGNQLVDSTLVEMAQTKSRVQAIAQHISRLSEQINQIGNISQLVSDLANQTNMLALNAAVEAVRAGEYGKGFAVVATEIRKLADESKKSANKINDLVAEIQQATNATVSVTEGGMKSVENTENLAQKTASAFVSMTGEINNIVINSQQIALNTQQQALAIQQVVTAMNNLNQNAQESNDGVTQVKTGIQRLSAAAVELKSIVKDD